MIQHPQCILDIPHRIKVSIDLYIRNLLYTRTKSCPSSHGCLRLPES